MISVVIPIYNEEQIIDELISRCVAVLGKMNAEFEIIFVDDGSKDRSCELLLQHRQKESRFKIISLSRNFGHQKAFLAGITKASGDFVVLMDGDLQDPPEMIPTFYENADAGFDIIYGVRRKRKEGPIKRLAYWAFYRLLKFSTSFEIPLDSGDFSMIRRRALDQIILSAEDGLFLRGIRSWVGFKQIGIEYERDRRFAGAPKYTLRKLFQLAYNGIFSFSDLPVKLIFGMGSVLLCTSFLYLVFLGIKFFVFGGVPEGFATLITVIIIFSSVQLISLGLIGEYVLRIYHESRNRPLFIIRESFF